jgi:beta-galactosidase
MHYFRVMPEQWPERLRLLRAMGLNTVDTYVPWNLHEPSDGEYRFDGLRDVERFLRDTAAAGLYAIVRPGPYICSEWDNGGLPFWLAGGSRALRSCDEQFMGPLERWFDELIPRLARHQVSAGGNIIMMQIENDYARFGTDLAYTRRLRDGLRRRGINTPLYVCEAPAEVGEGIRDLADVIGSVWLEAEPDGGLAALAQECPDDPLFCSEAVCGPIQHWGEPLNRRAASECADLVERLLARGASISLYMAHGGTNFGLWSGANLNGDKFLPSVTSYDYDSPIDEQGAPTEKFWRFREVFAPYAEVPPAPDGEKPATLPAGDVKLSRSVGLFSVRDALAKSSVDTAWPATFEDLGQQAGFVLYSATIRDRPGRRILTIHDLRDRAQIFLDGVECALLERNGSTSCEILLDRPNPTLDILVESLGRVNFAPDLGERKGITGGVRIGWRWVHGWTNVALDPDRLEDHLWLRQEATTAGPRFFHGKLHADQPLDAFVGLRGWKKGYVWINGFCLGRYWDRGPHHSLYLPRPLIRRGENEIKLLELHPKTVADPSAVQIRASHDID